MRIRPLGDCALIIECGTSISPENHEKVQQVLQTLSKLSHPAVIEFMPTYTSVAVYYDPFQISFDFLRVEIEKQLEFMADHEKPCSRMIEIPVCYGEEFGPDLSYVAQYHGLSEEEVIHLHSQQEYLVYMIGFVPGFPYLGGLPKQLATPRKTTPRLKVPAGSVGIAGEQTGIYPQDSPGGWQIIGRTPLSLFSPEANPPSLLVAGDRIRFVPITKEEFLQWPSR